MVYEYEAELFARELLVPNKYILALNDFTEESIVNFAKKINIHPGIVVGILQKDKKIKNTELNYLKEKYIIGR